MYEQGQDRTAPYGPPQAARVSHHIFRHQSGQLVIFAVILGLLGLALGAASLTFFLSYRSTTTAQIRQLQQAVANAQQSNQGNVSSLNSQASKIRSLNAAMAAIAQFDTVCSTDLTGPNGPAQWDFMCKLHPAGG